VPGGDAKVRQGCWWRSTSAAPATRFPSARRRRRGRAGPGRLRKLSYIAGGIPNQPAAGAWLIDPPAMKPGTAMPAMGLTEQEARHMAAFLYTLK
jgi:hypothetical protein